MSCLDVMYHQSYGAHHHLPAASATGAAAGYKAVDYHNQQQQKKLCSYSKMEGSMDLSVKGRQPELLAGEPVERLEEGSGDGEQGLGKEAQPAEAEYLSSRCVLFTYFQGDIGDVVDEHFSRALNQPAVFAGNGSSSRTPSRGLWRGGILSAGQCADFPSSLWNSGYPAPTSPCISSIRPDFSPSPCYHSAEQSAWVGPGLPRSSLAPLAPPPTPPDIWPYSLGAQGSASYSNVHEVYPHIHPPHSRHMVHHALGPTLDPRLTPLLLSSVCSPHSPSLHCEVNKTEPGSSSTTCSGSLDSWPTLHHGSLDIFDSSE
ncbi:hypothetical protein JZ751_029414 [Albula glossodonta]|uniref:Transcription cofactor vestigial-like protein 3 n=1 Tax=Albula glossodonta TaxID=121402 RepID=A0A8T2P8Y2_9TELE|nr:hypothetical protein JZ751_029414 [Albula glossodonta]